MKERQPLLGDQRARRRGRAPRPVYAGPAAAGPFGKDSRIGQGQPRQGAGDFLGAVAGAECGYIRGRLMKPWDVGDGSSHFCGDSAIRDKGISEPISAWFGARISASMTIASQ